MDRFPRKISRKEIISALYPIPDPLNSQEEDIRFRHEDLLTMTDAELNSEHFCVEWRIHFDRNQHPWLIERKERLNTLIHRGTK